MTRPAWSVVVLNAPSDEAEMFLGTFKRYTVARSNAVPCTICMHVEPHLMRYRILECGSPACARAFPGLTCSWRGRTLKCLKTDETSIFEYLSHASPVQDPRQEFLTAAQKAYIREMSALRMKPARIRNSMTRKFNLAVEDLPSLAKVQNFANYFKKKKLLNNDSYDDVVAYIREHAFTGAESETQPFVFGARSDGNGSPWIGIGSDEDPCVVGVTTKMLLMRLNRPPDSFIFHLDATYKLNQVGYPVLACGISDGNRSFHLVALFVMSQQQEVQFFEALSSLRRVYEQVLNKKLAVRYVMGDGDDAQYNGCVSVFAPDNNFIYLMCFYHVVAKVFQYTKALSTESKTRLTKDIYDMHFCRSPQQFVRLRDTCTAQWKANPETKPFAKYFVEQWLSGKFHQWQCFYTAVGFATTNNPIEQYNKVIKRDYSLRSQLKMGTLFKQLVECCFTESSNERQFRAQPEIPRALKRRVVELQKARTLYEVFQAWGVASSRRWDEESSLSLRCERLGFLFRPRSAPKRSSLSPLNLAIITLEWKWKDSRRGAGLLTSRVAFAAVATGTSSAIAVISSSSCRTTASWTLPENESS